MKTHFNYPTEVTPDERTRGFRLVQLHDPMIGSEAIAVAVLPLSPSARLIKTLAMPLFPGDSTVGYQLQIYASDTHPFINHPKPHSWQTVGSGPSSTIDAAIHRFRTEPLDQNFKLAVAPEEPTVTLPESK